MTAEQPTAAELVVAARRPPRDAAAAAKADAAFRQLYDRHRVEVYSFLVRLVGDAALAEDVLQETFFRVYKNLDRFEVDRPFRSWVFQIARHAAIDAIRERQKEDRLAREKASRVKNDSPPEPELERREDADQARAALDGIPEDARALLVQRHGLGMTLDELAESWSCTEKTVRNRLRAAAELLGHAVSALSPRRGGRP